MEEKLEQQPSNCIKIVLYGPESTGKTTLAKMLAVHYNTKWVPEFAREYLQEKWDREKKICELKDMLPIAIGQMKLENDLAKEANKILICDTDLLETKVYSEVYYSGFSPVPLDKFALRNKYHCYFLTYIDTPWTADDLRDRPDQRTEMFSAFKAALEKYNKPFIVLKGTLEERMKMATMKIDELLKAEKLEFTKEDVAQIEKMGLSVKQVEAQIELFKKGNQFVNISEAATPKNGITILSEEEAEKFINVFETKKQGLDILKFVPASGAATRMFKSLFSFLKDYNPQENPLHEFLERRGEENLINFFHNLNKLPFYEEVLKSIASNFPEYENASEDEKKLIFVKAMLTPKGLNLCELPKGLVPFHKYGEHLVTAFEDHLYEATGYAKNQNGTNVHFTVLEDHREKFEACFSEIKNKIGEQTNSTFQISFSYQDPKTDTIAVNMENEPFREPDGAILFRPGGHGALIDNLNHQSADIVFIKNIDNVAVPRLQEQTVKWKKILGGKLLSLQEKNFSILKRLDSEEVSEGEINEFIHFIKEELHSGLSFDFSEMTSEEKKSVLRKKLNRPIRVCGMVINEGEPGGGPFWINQKNGEISLQIVESAQIDMENYQQSQIVKESTHFNPVDLVCGLKDYKGNSFDLEKFVDQEAYFICNKTHKGQELKALELPGLWNGGMANWISVFVEVPAETFNPVKTTVDLLKSRHQVNV
ncbi:MAG TPA: DUF4301 family protein [Salinimicrobium sp.]|nr:DUF4301 family protein [Salinimicrobium sp.]